MYAEVNGHCQQPQHSDVQTLRKYEKQLSLRDEFQESCDDFEALYQELLEKRKYSYVFIYHVYNHDNYLTRH